MLLWGPGLLLLKACKRDRDTEKTGRRALGRIQNSEAGEVCDLMEEELPVASNMGV